MKLKNVKMSRLAGILVLVVVCLWAGCGDSPIGPGTHWDYPFYFANGASGVLLYTWNPASGAIDSVSIRWAPRVGISVSPDGDRLYLADRHKVVVIEAETRILLAELVYSPYSPVALSNDGSMIAIAGDGLHVLSAEDFSVVYSDTGRFNHCSFSANSQRVYAASYGSGRVVVIDFETSPPTLSLEETGSGSISTVIPTPDETKLLLYKTLGALVYAFEAFDVGRDSVVFRDVLSPGAGQIAMTPDGKLAFYSSPGLGATGPPPLLGFKVFDIGRNEIDRVVVDTAYFSSSWYIAAPNRVAISPDGRWLGILGGSLARFAVYGYDIREEELMYRKPPLGSGGMPFYVGIASQGAR